MQYEVTLDDHNFHFLVEYCLNAPSLLTVELCVGAIIFETIVLCLTLQVHREALAIIAFADTVEDRSGF